MWKSKFEDICKQHGIISWKRKKMDFVVQTYQVEISLFLYIIKMLLKFKNLRNLTEILPRRVETDKFDKHFINDNK